MVPRIIGALALLAALGLAACGTSTTPASPSPSTAPASSSQPGAAVGLSGVIAELNLRTGTFTLGSRGGSRTIRVDALTQVWSGGSRIRLSSLSNGLTADVRGTEQLRYVQAASVSVRR